MDRDVAVVPAICIGLGGGSAAQRGSSLVYFKPAEAGAGGIACCVNRCAARALVPTFAYGLRGWALVYARKSVGAGKADDHIVVVPTVGVGRAVWGRADCGRGLVYADAGRVSGGVARVVHGGTRNCLVLTFGCPGLWAGAASDTRKAVVAGEIYGQVGVVPAVRIRRWCQRVVYCRRYLVYLHMDDL